MSAPGWHRNKDGSLDLCGRTGLRVAYIMPCFCGEGAAVAWGLDGFIFASAEHGHAGAEVEAQRQIADAFVARDVSTATLASETLPPGGPS